MRNRTGVVYRDAVSSPAVGHGGVFGTYELHDEIASGGMAAVHLGRRRGPVGFSRIVAIKRLHPHFARDPEFVAMLIDEAHLAGRVRHPNVASIVDVIASDGELLLVMDYVPGAALAELVRASSTRSEPVPIPIAIGIASGMLLGLHAAHETCGPGGAPLAIVHRDVSPQNVLVGVDGVARVVDFGIATATWRLQTTRDGRLKGKFRYMAPEQIANEPVDRRADIYAASVVLWETLTGQRLARSDNPAAIVHDAMVVSWPPPSSLRPDIPPALDAIVLRGMAKQRDDRCATALEMASALEQVIKPASAREIGEWVAAVGGPALRARAEKLEAIESDTPGERSIPEARALAPTELLPGESGRAGAAGEYSAVVASPAKATTPWRRIWWAALPLVAALAVALPAWRLTGGSRPELLPFFHPTRFVPAATTPVERSAPVVSSAAPSQPRPVPPRIAPAPRARCNPPYTFVNGMKRWKPECL